MPDRDPDLRFAVSIIALGGSKRRKVKHRLELISAGGETGARSFAVENFQAEHPEFEIWDVLVEAVDSSETKGPADGQED